MRKAVMGVTLAVAGLASAVSPTTAWSLDDLRVLPNGRIVVGHHDSYLGSDDFVAVLQPNGSLNTNFAGDGVLWTPGAYASTAQRDGKLIVVSARRGSGYVHRYKPSGSLDRSFHRRGKNGVVRLRSAGAEVTPQDVLVRRNGEVLVGAIWFCHGADRGCNYTQSYLHLIRLDPQGRFRHFGNAWAGELFGMSLAPGGKVLAVAYGDETDPIAIRFNARSNADRGFGSDGWLLLPHATDPADVAALPDGSAVIAANEGIAGLTRRGKPDRAFGVEGVAACPGSPPASSYFTPGSFDAVAVQPDGRILAVGRGCGLTRFNARGGLDPSFAPSGVPVPVPVNDYSRADVAVQADGGIVVASWDSAQKALEVSRFRADGSPDPSFGIAGTATIPVA